jgi:hypothetical protein
MSYETIAVVRHRNGKKNIYSMPGRLSWDFARMTVLEQVPSARAVLVLVPPLPPIDQKVVA